MTIVEESTLFYNIRPGRNDLFVLRTFCNYDKPFEIVLNENKLAKVYK